MPTDVPDFDSWPDPKEAFAPTHGTTHEARHRPSPRVAAPSGWEDAFAPEDMPGHVGRIADNAITELRAKLEAERDGRIQAIHFPWWQADSAVGNGLAPGEVTVLAGPPGASKSYFALNILRAASHGGFRWRLLPLEDDAMTWIQRYLAVELCDWRMVARPKAGDERERVELAERKLAMLDVHRDLVGDLRFAICENPRMPVAGPGGKTVVPDVTWRDVLGFIEREGDDNDLLVVDPLSQMTFDPEGRNNNAREADFTRNAVALARSSRTHLLLVAHTVKGTYRTGAAGGVESIQGSAMLTRLAHNVLTVTRHDPAMESEIYNAACPMVSHRITLEVAKSRSGHSGNKIAFDLEKDGPRFKEHGLIKSRPLRGGKA